MPPFPAPRPVANHPYPPPPDTRAYVRCMVCKRAQADRGCRKTCEQCGTSPLPSREYPIDSAFNPDRRS